MKLVIVESPTKARTISRFLKGDYQLTASQGHVRDLPPKRFGIKIEETPKGWRFEPQYQLVKEKKPLLAELKKEARQAEEVILATDPDREGEAIAWHLWQLLAKPGQKFRRVVFHEITPAAIKKAFQEGGEINLDLVAAQQARRVLDRIVGYKLSPLLWRKIKRGLSAGRVQSVALRLIVEREREIAAFQKHKFYQLAAGFAPGGQRLVATLWRWQGQPVEKKERRRLFAGWQQLRTTVFADAKGAEKVALAIGSEAIVQAVEEKERQRQPPPPLATASLQREAARRWGWSPKLTMRVAQSLYEKGWITYHRTDSLNLSQVFIGTARRWIGKKWGKKYLPNQGRQYHTRAKVAQEAHEAIRPTEVEREELAGADSRQRRLYRFIWERALASQMAAARLLETKIILADGDFTWQARGVRLLFPGFWQLLGRPPEDSLLPKLKKGQKVAYQDLGIIEQATQPPPRYTPASLVAILEKKGIGRPSTYAPIISLIQDRGYVEKKEGHFYPTKLGIAVSDFLSRYFPKIMSLPFTAQLEDDLDKVAAGQQEWEKPVAEFWQPFINKVEKTLAEAERVKIELEKIGEKCPKCGKGELVIRHGKYGKFVACSRYPECDYTRPYLEPAGFNCPDCGAPVVIRYTKKGRRFYGCSRYPKCKWASWKKPKNGARS